MIDSTEHPRWRKAKRCGTQTCVEVARVSDGWLVRDSKKPEVTPLAFTDGEWQSFVGGVRDGDFDF